MKILKRAKDTVLRQPPIDNFLRLASMKKLDYFHANNLIIEPEKTVIESFQFKGFGRYRSIEPVQNPSELIELANIVEEKQPEVVAEIGTDDGGTMYVWTHILENAEKFISIDLPGGRFGGGYSGRRATFYKYFTDKAMHSIRRNSHENETKEMLKEKLSGDEIDFLFIDGDHTYEGVKQDFEMYKDLVADNGLIAFHDVHPHSEGSGVEVDRFWNEIKDDYNTTEIVADEEQEWAGIGVIRLD